MKKIEAIIKPHRVDAVKSALSAIGSARTESTGDRKIFVTDLEDVIRIRTGEHGPGAI